MLAIVFFHVAALLAMEAWPKMRDPEYTHRAEQLRGRVAEHPNRPLVLVVGSSRACMGVKPDAWESARPGSAHDPLLFNMSTVGAGPIQELMTVQRVNGEGARPAVVLIEYWPPFLRQDAKHAEGIHADPRRLRLAERSIIRGCFPPEARIERRMWAARFNAFRENGSRWLVQLAPRWVARPWEVNGPWAGLDGWGWLPGMELPPGDTTIRPQRLKQCERYYRDRFDGYTIHANSDWALREAVTQVRAHGGQVGFLFLPESSEFRSWYPPVVESAFRDHLAGLSRELAVPVIDARDWMEDGYLTDGFHLSRIGAAKFTERLGPAVVAAFPELGDRP
ncbi:MAG: SGNH/GDSL hydrolase family protein [Planctomycetia bacterium]|nr:SGNH/GDSL hydrolase family protein [Planctomycetia bacterium]